MTALDIKAIRAAVPISSVIAARVALARAGHEWKGCCPFHEDRTPSFTVNDVKGFYHCFGCNAHGDVLDFIQAMDKVGLRRAAEMVGQLPAAITVPIARVREPGNDENRERALAIWGRSRAIAGTPAETYLRSRGIICRLPECLRFARFQYGKRGREYNCLVALAATADGVATGIQRTFLNDSGTGKASVPKAKLSLGRISGSAIRLAPTAAEMVVCEGLEDGLTLQQELGVATWVSAGVGNFRSLELPAGVRSVIIGADNDTSGRLGAEEATKRFRNEGRNVRVIYPLDGHKDFNDELRGVAR